MKVGNWRLALGIALVGGYLGGCAQNVPDIDRTQPDKVQKSHFLNDDEWYYRQTIVETDQMGSGGAFEAWEGQLKRIRWSVTEDALIAWSTQEPADGLYDAQQGEDDRRVGVVAMFPIQGHFDVERSYSPATGEQTNVITEAGGDRHWYERKYMRVDWSRNLADSNFWMAGQVTGTILGRLSATARTVPQQDGYIDPDRTRFVDLEPEREGIEYLDTVTEYYYSPDVFACFTTYGFDTVFNCEAGTVRMRNSFLKLPETNTYAPFDYLDAAYIDDENGKKLYTARVVDIDLNKVFFTECDDYAKNYMRDNLGYETEDMCRPAVFDFHQRFGYFRTEGVSYDVEYGANYEEQRLYYANRWNIWETMLNEDGSMMDMQDRVPKPIVYYTNPEYPLDMWDAAQETAHQWDLAFTEAAAIAKGVTPAAITEELTALHGEQYNQMFQIRWNSCSAPMLQQWFDANGAGQGEDRMNVASLRDEFIASWGGSTLEEAVWASPHRDRTQFCAKLEYATETRADGGFSWERVGDLRYSFFNWVDQEVPWLGYGPSAADPATGEIISGNANFAGTALRAYGPYAADLVQYMNGELDQDTISHGDHVRDYLRKTRDQVHEQRQSLSPEGKREMSRRAGVNPSHVSPTNFESRPTLAELPTHFHQVGLDRTKADALRSSVTNLNARASDTRAAEFYDNSTVRNIMMSDPNMQLMVESNARAKYGPNYNEDDLHQAFLDVSTPGLTLARMEKRDRVLGEQSIMMQDTLDRALEALVTYAGVNEAYRGKSREEISRMFIEQMFIGTQLHEIGHTVGLRHNFSASIDTMNYHDEYWDIQRAIADGEIEPEERWSIQGPKAAEISGRDDIDYLNEAEFRLASVMDYTGDFTGRFGGLGKYDHAAINFAYAEAVEQFKPDVELNNFYDIEMFLSDYTELPRIMAGAGGSGPGSTDVQKRGIDIITDGREYVPIREAIEQYRNGVKVNTENWKNGEFAGGVNPWIDRTVPYEFCSDEYRGAQLGCDVFDWGSNQREVVNHQFNSYRLFQPFRRYNRGRIFKAYENLFYYQNWVARTLRTVENPFRYYSYYQWYDYGAYTDDLREASIDAINFYAEIMAMPQPGRYCAFGENTGVSPYWWFELDDVYVPSDWDRFYGECDSYIDVNKGDGQFYGYEFTQEYDYRLERIGTYVDKSITTMALFQLNSNYVDSNFFTDFRATNVTYWTLFQEELLGFLRGTIIGDYKGFAAVYNKQTGSMERPRIVDAKTFGLGLPSDQAGMNRIYTPVSFAHELNMLIGAMLYNHTWLDRHTDFGQYIKIAVTNDELQPFPEATEIHTFTHPTTYQIYTAVQTQDGASIAVELVQWANDLSTRVVGARTDRDAQTPGTPAYAAAQDLFDNRSQQLEDVISKMDQVRWVYEALGADGLR